MALTPYLQGVRDTRIKQRAEQKDCDFCSDTACVQVHENWYCARCLDAAWIGNRQPVKRMRT